jgi:hypothetical protein
MLNSKETANNVRYPLDGFVCCPVKLIADFVLYKQKTGFRLLFTEGIADCGIRLVYKTMNV